MVDIWGCGGNGMLLYVVWIGKHELHDGIVIHDVSIMGTLIGWWNMYNVWVGRNSMTLVVRAHDGASSIGRNPMDPPNESP